MFLTYLRREMRHRPRQSAVVAVGIAVGVGLVIIVSAVSTGLRDAQDSVLRSLTGGVTRLVVTMTPGSQPSVEPSARPSATGSRQDTLYSRRLGPIPATAVSEVRTVSGVDAAAGALILTDLQLSVPTGGNRPGRSPGPSPSAAALGTQIFTVAGLDPAAPGLGPLASLTSRAGRALSAADANADVALVGSEYAARQGITVGKSVTVGGAALPVVGLVASSADVAPADVYLPLRRTQALAGMADQVNTIYVEVRAGTDTAAVRGTIASVVPGATVGGADADADAIDGSLATASALADDLGRWLATAALLAAFLIAGLLTTSAVNRRVQEFGTLKALGWRSRRVVGQVVGEAAVTGMLGGVLGVALGYGGSMLVTALTPELGASIDAGGADVAATVRLTAPVQPDALLLAVLLAIVGGLIAGGFGGWRAATLRPAAALTQIV